MKTPGSTRRKRPTEAWQTAVNYLLSSTRDNRWLWRTATQNELAAFSNETVLPPSKALTELHTKLQADLNTIDYQINGLLHLGKVLGVKFYRQPNYSYSCIDIMDRPLSKVLPLIAQLRMEAHTHLQLMDESIAFPIYEEASDRESTPPSSGQQGVSALRSALCTATLCVDRGLAFETLSAWLGGHWPEIPRPLRIGDIESSPESIKALEREARDLWQCGTKWIQRYIDRGGDLTELDALKFQSCGDGLEYMGMTLPDGSSIKFDLSQRRVIRDVDMSGVLTALDL